MRTKVVSETAKVKAERGVIRALIFAFICMIMGALFYSAKTETIDNCRAIYDDLTFESSPP